MKTSFEKFALTIALALIFTFGLFSILNKSMIWDERCYVGAGKYIFKTGNLEYNLFVAHPPLSFYLNSIFILPIKFPDKIYMNDNCWEIGYDMVYHSGYSPKLILTLVRLPFIIMSLILALYIFYWAKELYGLRSGYLALILYTFNTAIISHSNLALTDLTVTFFIFVTMYYYWKFTHSNKKFYLYLASILFGFALLSKLTGLILVPVLTILVLYKDSKYRLNRKNLVSSIKKLFVIFIIGFLVMLAGFGFQFKPLKNVMPEHYVNRAYEEIDKQFNNDAIRNFVIYTFENVPVPFPSYFFGLGAVAFHSKEGLGNFLNGEIISKTVWYFPIAVFFYKTQISLLILFLLSILLFNRTRAKNMTDEYIQILPMIAVFMLFMLNNMTAGLRHILPIYPLIFLFCSKITKLKKGWLSIAILILLLHYIMSSLLVFPHYFAYFNEFASGPANGYKHLVGANLDNGQDLPGLKKFIEDNNIEKINLSYFGSVNPKEYVNYDYLPSPYFQHWVPDYVQHAIVRERDEDCSEKKGWVAISATNLQNVHMVNKACFNWLKKYEPVVKIGYSIFVYNISDKS